MKHILQISIMTIAFVLCVILEILQKVVIWDSTLKENLKYSYDDYMSTFKFYSKKIYWPEVMGAFAIWFALMGWYFYITDATNKLIVSGVMSLMVITWSILLDARPTYQVTGNKKWSIYAILLLFIIVVLASSCSSAKRCPTTDKKYFMRNVPKSKSLFKGYGTQKGYIVPYKKKKKLFGKG